MLLKQNILHCCKIKDNNEKKNFFRMPFALSIQAHRYQITKRDDCFLITLFTFINYLNKNFVMRFKKKKIFLSRFGICD